MARIEDALRESPIFSQLGRIGLARLARQCTMERIAGGQVLYREGSPGDALYLVAHGRMRAERETDNGIQVVRELKSGETMGGLSLMAGKAHRATLRAMRDSEVVRIGESAVERLLYRHPTFGREAVRQWLRSVLYAPPRRVGDERRSARTLAVVPAHEGAPVEVVADALMKSLTDRGTVVRTDGQCMDGPQVARRCEWDLTTAEGVAVLDALESDYDFVVYMARRNDDDWCARCLRQADRIVVIASSGTAARASALSEQISGLQGHAEPEVVIVGAGASDRLAWRALYGARMHHRVEVGDRAAFDRMVRLLTGKAVGLALGGGGARGFAHIGLLKAMERLGMRADLVVGTSMGALIGALYGSGLGADGTREVAHGMFVQRNLLNDFTLPRVSLIRARRARQHLEQIFGSTRIEEMRGYFACMTTNLTRARPELHDHGLLSHWLVASMSVPGVAPPVIYNGDVLVDGGVLTPVPSDALADLGRGPVIASDVSANESFGLAAQDSPAGQAEKVNIFRVLYRTATLSTAEERDARAARTDLFLRMPVGGTGMFDWDQFDQLVSRATDYSEQQLQSWLKSSTAASFDGD
ncbi:patatin-like phospholipase family protein [Algiphilus sp. NNCM1]|uniref:cyclic nucleotide-binding and patatin-like phospholipase domain-containing protein n=1 Tax=Algiphilus sp. TaxID=1872431 RepID=UPI001CA6C977|nr:cyclic nucleotide-binding and patatin-like phospholipase domain-containing protein [Algiphilus sp.]MBY8965066.1 patatin-like phospholipase family protein [Algiphilus acroporae]MCI5063461.1 patatin-like phospholipase domain-containing protein [Algiphilus sp.]MCI5104219.1 patatin-like phospholipase domain-containing protein [Algiphilus sp.]